MSESWQPIRFPFNMDVIRDLLWLWILAAVGGGAYILWAAVVRDPARQTQRGTTIRVPRSPNMAELPANIRNLRGMRQTAAWLDRWRPLFDRTMQERSGILGRIQAKPDGPAADSLRHELALADAAIQKSAQCARSAIEALIPNAPGGIIRFEAVILAEPPRAAPPQVLAPDTVAPT